MIHDDRRYNVAILGGDRRQAVVAKRLLERGHTVKLYGIGTYATEIDGAQICSTLEKALSGSEVILLPLPVSKDKINLALIAESASPQITLTSIVELASRNGCKTIVGGIIPTEIKRISEIEGIGTVDFYLDEEFQKKNALPSAEGAVMIAMEHTEKVLQGMKALVCGYGRVGMRLASLLKKLGVAVTVAARGDCALCDAAMSGYNVIRIDEYGSELITAISDCDVIFNTVPSVIFSEKILMAIDRPPLYIEIASAPGGIDVAAAREKQMRVIFAPSIPGKYAPVTAGEYIFETVSEILEKRGIKL